jgi:hypothetical protein
MKGKKEKILEGLTIQKANAVVVGVGRRETERSTLLEKQNKLLFKIFFSRLQ